MKHDRIVEIERGGEMMEEEGGERRDIFYRQAFEKLVPKLITCLKARKFPTSGKQSP